jgi:hypothetical protein
MVKEPSGSVQYLTSVTRDSTYAHHAWKWATAFGEKWKLLCKLESRGWSGSMTFKGEVNDTEKCI